MIIYDKRNLDSAFSAALLRYYYEVLLETPQELDIFSLDEKSYILSKTNDELKSEYSGITFVNCLFPLSDIDRLYNSFINDLTFIICNKNLTKKIKNRYLSSDKYFPGDIFLYEEDESCSMYIYKVLRGNINIPNEIKYISSFEMNNYPDEGFTREEVMKYNYGLIKKYNNFADELYDYVKNLMDNIFSLPTSDIEVPSLDEINSLGEDYISTIDDYILYNYRIYGSPIYTVSGNRKAILLQTPYKLSANIVGNDLFRDYDNIITAYLTENGKFLVGLYTLPNFVDVEEGSNMTDNQESESLISVFNSNEYLNSKFGSEGNELFGFAEVSQDDMLKILSTRNL